MRLYEFTSPGTRPMCYYVAAATEGEARSAVFKRVVLHWSEVAAQSKQRTEELRSYSTMPSRIKPAGWTEEEAMDMARKEYDSLQLISHPPGHVVKNDPFN